MSLCESCHASLWRTSRLAYPWHMRVMSDVCMCDIYMCGMCDIYITCMPESCLIHMWSFCKVRDRKAGGYYMYESCVWVICMSHVSRMHVWYIPAYWPREWPWYHIWMGHDSCMCVTWLIYLYMSDAQTFWSRSWSYNHIWMRHDSCIRVIWLIRKYVRQHMRHTSFLAWNMIKWSRMDETWLIHTSDMTHMYTYKTHQVFGLAVDEMITYGWDMTHAHRWYDSYI